MAMMVFVLTLMSVAILQSDDSVLSIVVNGEPSPVEVVLATTLQTCVEVRMVGLDV